VKKIRKDTEYNTQSVVSFLY